MAEEPTCVALAWLLFGPEVIAPIIGPRSAEQLALAERALHTELSAETLAHLDELFPPIGKGGPVPEAWAW